MTSANNIVPASLEKPKSRYQLRLRQFTAELQLLREDVSSVRGEVSLEAARCASLKLSLGAAERRAAAAQAEASAAAAAGAHASAERAKEHEAAARLALQLDVAERERTTLRERVRTLEVRCASNERELEEQRGRRDVLAAAQRAAQDAQLRAQQVAEHTQSSVSRLESELRRVTRSAEAGVALRERARLVAAAHSHARERADSDHEHDRRRLKNATEENNMLRLRVKELESAISKPETSCVNTNMVEWAGTVAELRAQLANERAAYERVTASLAAAIKDNAQMQHAQRERERHVSALEQQPEPAMLKHNTSFAEEQFLGE